ncbi:spindle pole body component 97 [Mytilinidion resinicola]|uniref:Spindle pole body component n=1 Tax=Mytilinidion resinicola TaxID=574789 RepID=A0A6A6YPY2_9PEZI|nr:spindle pole body component 97 [Mytilinidion resinicola]KAF2810811.1 spindle pole body component 97 [Mytilinidion resinicola]
MSSRHPPASKLPSPAERKASTSTVGGARPRVVSSSSKLGENERRAPAAHLRKPSGATTGPERRTEKKEVLTRETVTVRPRSPLKHTSESRVNARSRRDADRVPKPAERASASNSGSRKGLEEIPEIPWAPQATIIPHTAAPLASRVSIPPLASTAPQALQPQPLNQLSLDAQEAAIIEDLLFVFMGFEGQYIRFVETYNPSEEKDRLIGPQFRILAHLDPSLRDLTISMLKMATHYTAVEASIEVLSREEFGAVNHALCATVRHLLKDYLVLMAQLEHQMLTNPAFTLHVLNLHTKPTSHMLFQLYTMGTELLKANGVLEDDENSEDSSDDSDNLEGILESLREGGQAGLPAKKICKGGNVLGLITKRLASMSGDPAARTLLTRLLRDASRPYMAMLNEWLHHGGIKDPHAEFLIKEQKSIKRERLDQDYTDEYWEKRYTVRDSLVPPQLEGVKDKVLLAGKYLNVVRECGGVDVSKVVQDVPQSFDDPRFLENVNAAYAYANSSLFNLLLTTHALPARLRSLKHYFFLDRSDFFTYFLELGTSELKKPAKLVNIGKLQSLLDIVLRQPGSVAAEDPFKEDVKVQMNEVGLTNWLMKIVNVTGLDQDAATGAISNYTTPATQAPVTDDKDITGFDALVLDYAMPFPLSLVVSRVTLTRYQLLFRYLLSLRHLETLLVGSWTDHSKVLSWKHRSKNPRIEMWKRKAWTLRARMLIFVQQMLYYCTSEVIEPNWVSLMSRLNEGSEDVPHKAGEPAQVKRTVDELMQDHVDFLATCLKECMLTNSKLLRINSKILATCTMFANFTSSLSRYLVQADPELANAATAAASAASAPSKPTHGHSKSASTSITFDPAKVDKMFDIMHKYEDNFSRHLKILLDTLNYLAATETVVFLSLCARLSTANEGGPGQGDVY